MFANAFQDKTVWFSGATGFKGSWLAEWLLTLGARVHGYGLRPHTTPGLFDQLQLGERIKIEFNDIRDAAAVRRSMAAAQPDFVFHLAAQPLVRLSYDEPLETYSVNIMGTAHVLEALRSLKKNCAAVFITTDKVYENREWVYGYREDDALGGHDPYSASKASAEIAISAWRRSFFSNHPVKIASARAGNVIGGGDWALDRITPDCMRALPGGQAITVRNKTATRPWQHVLEPLSGYLWLAALLANSGLGRSDVTHASAFNFGPDREANRTVGEFVEEVLKHWPGRWEDKSDPAAVHEAHWLHLTTDKARAELGWAPVWPFAESIRQTVRWYREAAANGDPNHLRALTRRQIEEYSQQAIERGVLWAQS